MGISLKKIKKSIEANSKALLVDLSKFIPELKEELVIPFKSKPLREQLEIKANTDFGKMEIQGVKSIPFHKLPKEMQELYADYSPANLKGQTIVRVIDDSKNQSAYKALKFNERLLDIVIHIDMDYEIDKDLNMWQDIGIERGDYRALVNLFAEYITTEKMLDVLSYLVSGLKEGYKEDIMLDFYIKSQVFHAELSKLDEDARARVIAEVQKSIDSNIEKAKESEEKSPKKTKEEVVTNG